MDHIKCRVCAASARFLFDAELLRRQVSYYECDHCGYVQTESPTWLEEAYESSINLGDTGILQRNARNTKIVIVALCLLKQLKSKVVDCAGGYGILTRLLRDIGVDAYWQDPYTKNLLAQGFEYDNRSGAALVTAFEAFEHFVDPLKELDHLLSISPNVLISTELICGSTPAIDDWWYYGTDHGQHIGFFRKRTLEYLATSRNMNLLSDGKSYHLFTRTRCNGQLWAILMKFKSLMRLYASSKLVSKTWSDHKMLEGS